MTSAPGQHDARAEHPPQARHLGADADLVESVVGEQFRKSATGQPLRMGVEQHADLGVPPGQRPRGAADTDLPDQAGLRPERVEPEATATGPITAAPPRHDESGRGAQFPLGEHRGGPDEGEHLVRGGTARPRDVDEADEFPGGGIMDRRRRTAPRLCGLEIVLGAAHTNLRVMLQREPGGVGPDRLVRPDGAGDEGHRLGTRPYPPVTDHPEKTPPLVRDGDDVPTGDHAGDEDGFDDREN